MRLLVAFSLLGLLAACSGDSSSVMSVWTDGDGGAGSGGLSGSGGRGGSGGQTTSAQGGSGGNTTGSINVRGGTRDVATAQCTTTSNGGGCPFTAADLECVQGPCGTYLRACYQGTTGVCADYAVCMQNCPCDSGRSTCESDCLQNKALSNGDCAMCALDLASCYSKNGCLLPNCSGGATTDTGG
jgi:hypothetical protein